MESQNKENGLRVSDQHVPVVSPAEAIIQTAIERNVPVETLERLLAMRRELKAEAAKEAFDFDMAALQGEIPVIKKTKDVNDKAGKLRYRYAPIDAIVDQVKHHVADRGFSYSITTEQTSEKNSEVLAICTIKHRMGHSEASSFRVPIDLDSYMTAPQKVAAALTFAKRYAFCNAFGIMTGDEDNDANIDEEKTPRVKESAPKQTVTEQKPPYKPSPNKPASIKQIEYVKRLVEEQPEEKKTEIASWLDQKGMNLTSMTSSIASAIIDRFSKPKNPDAPAGKSATEQFEESKKRTQEKLEQIQKENPKNADKSSKVSADDAFEEAIAMMDKEAEDKV